MNIDLLIKMANEISSFWGGESGEEVGAKEVASHIRRFWEPRMRAQMYQYFEERQGAGLSDIAKKAIVQLMEQAKQEKATGVPAGAAAGGAQPGVSPSSGADFSPTPNQADPYGGDAG